MQRVISENIELREQLKAFYKVRAETPSQSTDEHGKFVTDLMISAKENSGRLPNGRRFEDSFKMFCCYIFILAGRYVYSVLCANIKPIPDVRSRAISDAAAPLVEGVLRLKELKQYLLDRGLPLVVWISEDATKITGRVQYDPSTNQIVGFPLPYDSDGVPISLAYPAESASLIMSYFEKHSAAQNAQVIMAQPVRHGSSAFVLGIFGTDNRFKADVPQKRWNWIKSEAEKESILVLGTSTDGDPKFLKAMESLLLDKKSATNLPGGWTWCAPFLSDIHCFVQDMLHLAIKLKRAFCNEPYSLRFGRFDINSAHLKYMIRTSGKHAHGITDFDLAGTDAMNFRVVLKMIDPRVRQELSAVPESDGTVLFLETVKAILDSFLDKSLKPRERLHLLWRSLFIFRIWRSWLLAHPSYSLKNFITSNAFLCIEINAHAMLALIRKLRDDNTPELFLPWLFSSQACEEFFRAARSMTSTLSTVVNFSIYEFINRAKRIEFSLYATNKLAKEGYQFPKDQRKAEEGNEFEWFCLMNSLPSDDEIEATILDAMRDAEHTAAWLGVEVPDGLDPPNFRDLDVAEDVDDGEGVGVNPNSPDTTTTDVTEGEDMPCELLSIDLGSFYANNSSNDSSEGEGLAEEQPDPKSPFVMVKDARGKSSLMRKSTLCWLATTQGLKLSSDRGLRVRTDVDKLRKKYAGILFVNKVSVEMEISCGSWCVFLDNNGRDFFIGCVLGFKYLTGKGKDLRFTWSSAPVTTPEGTIPRGLGCLCTWYTVNTDRTLKFLDRGHNYYDISQYLCTIPIPELTNNKLTITPETAAGIREMLFSEV